MMASTRSVTVDTDAIMRNIFVIRGRRVLLDSDSPLCIRWRQRRLPVQCVAIRVAFRRFHVPTCSRGVCFFKEPIWRLKDRRGKHRKYAPYVFTEQGIAMLSSVLTSERAVQVTIEIMRAFIRLRQAVSTHEELAHKLVALENKYDRQFKVVLTRSVALMQQPSQAPGIGFTAEDQRLTDRSGIPYSGYRSGARAECDEIPSLRGPRCCIVRPIEI